MDYAPIKIQKTVQCLNFDDEKFDIDWDLGVGRCPDCQCEVISPVQPIEFFRTNSINGPFNASDIKRFLLITPDTLTRIHLTYMTFNDNTITIEFFEDATVSNNGTVVPSINDNRNSALVSELLIFSDPTITIDGTSIDKKRIPSGRGEFLPPEIFQEHEFILKQDTIYQLKIVSINNNAYITTRFNWLEVK